MQFEDSGDETMEIEMKKAKKRRDKSKTNKQSLNSKMISQWSEQLQSEKPFDTINQVVKAFRAALNSVKPSSEKDEDFKVEGSDSKMFCRHVFKEL